MPPRGHSCALLYRDLCWRQSHHIHLSHKARLDVSLITQALKPTGNSDLWVRSVPPDAKVQILTQAASAASLEAMLSVAAKDPLFESD